MGGAELNTTKPSEQEPGYSGEAPHMMGSSPMNHKIPESPPRFGGHSMEHKAHHAISPLREDRNALHQAKIGSPWTSGLFDCGEHQTNSTLTAFFPCVTFGQIAEILDEGETSCTLSSFMYILMVPALLTCWILGSNYRKRLRNKYNLVQAPAEDWTVHLFCPCCALCQEFRELRNRGIDPSLGWMGYLAQQQETRTVPPNNQFMSK